MIGNYLYVVFVTMIDEIQFDNRGYCGAYVKLDLLTWGILKSRSKLATWMEVTLDAAPTTPDITFRT